jgi:hypothetical protein
VKNLHELDHLRVTDPWVVRMYGSTGDGTAGVFRMKHLAIIASNGEGWDHVSVSLPDRTPTWAEMEAVKRAFFEDHEVAMQLHVPPKDHISVHPHCLHLWRPHGVEIPLPPKGMVG